MITEFASGMFTECSWKDLWKCLWNGHIKRAFVERLVCLVGFHVKLKNTWPSKPRDNRSGTEAKLHGNLKAGVRAVCLGSSGVSGVAVWGAAGDPGPEVPGASRNL